MEKDELALQEKEDFIDQLNCLLERKNSIANLTVNTRKYKELVDCLSKMEKIDSQIGRKGLKHLEEGSPSYNDHDLEEDDEESLQSTYITIIEEVKNILNGKFR
jgi:hypothetical protein